MIVHQSLPDLSRLLTSLTRAGHDQYSTHLRHLYDYIQTHPMIGGVVQELKAASADFDIAVWSDSQFSDDSYGRVRWPTRETDCLRAYWYLIENCLGDDPTDPAAFAQRIRPSGGGLNEDVRTFGELVVLPVVEYLVTRIESHSTALYLLERFRRRVEWFERDSLHHQYEANRARGEALYDGHLRLFLFDQGVDYPFSQPRSASGAVDVVANITTADPLVCEIKLFDDQGYRASYLAKGVRQSVRYARDWGTSVAHLLIVNLSAARLQLPSDHEHTSPPRLLVQGITVFLCVVDALPSASASRDKREVRVIRREDLVTEDAD